MTVADEVLKANIVYHSALAEMYDVKQPCFKPENVARVEHILASMAARTGGGSLLDLGCGTGFVINIAKKHFQRVVGVDITPAMLEQVDTSDGQIELHLADTAHLPLSDGEFDVCTAYGFLHHLCNLRPTLSEAYRCLRSGGLFYSDQDPNYHYWRLMNTLRYRGDLSRIVEREVKSVVSVIEDVAAENKLSPEIVSLAEFYKTRRSGFAAAEVISLMKRVGFCSVRYRYEWFMRQGEVVRQQSIYAAQVIEDFLRDRLPTTQHLFKYLSFYAEKV